jgi:hypothetical protein
MVKIGKNGGDDRYSWALFIGGQVVYNGMDRSEAAWRRSKVIANILEGKPRGEWV